MPNSSKVCNFLCRWCKHRDIMATNPCAATPAAVCEDLFASLPPELTLHILSYLDGEDAVHCLAVNKSWKEVVGSRDTYWKKACVQFGLPEDLIEEHILHKKCCASPVALFVAARRQRLYISQSSGVFARLERDGEYSVPNRKPSKTGAKKGHVVTPPTLPGKKRKSQTIPGSVYHNIYGQRALC